MVALRFVSPSGGSFASLSLGWPAGQCCQLHLHARCHLHTGQRASERTNERAARAPATPICVCAWVSVRALARSPTDCVCAPNTRKAVDKSPSLARLVSLYSGGQLVVFIHCAPLMKLKRHERAPGARATKRAGARSARRRASLASGKLHAREVKRGCIIHSLAFSPCFAPLFRPRSAWLKIQAARVQWSERQTKGAQMRPQVGINLIRIGRAVARARRFECT